MSLTLSVKDLDQALAQQTTKVARPPLADGTYKVKITEAEYAKGFQDPTKYRLKIKWEIIGDTAQAGALINHYFAVSGKSDAEALKVAAPIIKVAMDNRIAQSKIEDDADDYGDVLSNIASLVNKRIAKGEIVEATLKLTWDGKDEAKKQFWKNLVF